VTAKILDLTSLRAMRDDDLTPVECIDSSRSPRVIAARLLSGDCPLDRIFDAYLPQDLRAVSSWYWSPLAVALRAARWLNEIGAQSLVDIGSGAGKFCVAAALAGECRFVGIEQRPRLVAAARNLARVFDCDDRVEFVEGVFGASPVPEADAYYLFNPFGENVFKVRDRLDDGVELSEERYRREIAATREFLANSRIGTYLLTYNGFGGQVPASYQEIRAERDLPNVLRLWRKAEDSWG
jgi:predicted RNA methylase